MLVIQVVVKMRLRNGSLIIEIAKELLFNLKWVEMEVKLKSLVIISPFVLFIILIEMLTLS